MRFPTARAGAAALAVTAALLVAVCTADADSGADEPEPTQTETSVPEDTAEPTGPAEVPDVTLLILETALGNMSRAGLEVETVDASGAPVTVDDPTTYKVVAQDPAEGTLEPGQTVTLTVESRG